VASCASACTNVCGGWPYCRHGHGALGTYQTSGRGWALGRPAMVDEAQVTVVWGGVRSRYRCTLDPGSKRSWRIRMEPSPRWRVCIYIKIVCTYKKIERAGAMSAGYCCSLFHSLPPGRRLTEVERSRVVLRVVFGSGDSTNARAPWIYGYLLVCASTYVS
jgi:hypothetical protein